MWSTEQHNEIKTWLIDEAKLDVIISLRTIHKGKRVHVFVTAPATVDHKTLCANIRQKFKTYYSATGDVGGIKFIFRDVSEVPVKVCV